MMRNFDKYRTLEVINGWTQNCDTKVSIILGIYGVLFTVLFTSDLILAVRHILHACINNITLITFLYLFILVISIATFIYGVIKLISVLIPRIDLSSQSIMFFGSIGTHTSFQDYKTTVDTYDADKLDTDILQQIFAAAKICCRKFQNQKTGLIYSLIGTAGIFVWLVIGFFWCYF